MLHKIIPTKKRNEFIINNSTYTIIKKDKKDYSNKITLGHGSKRFHTTTTEIEKARKDYKNNKSKVKSQISKISERIKEFNENPEMNHLRIKFTQDNLSKLLPEIVKIANTPNQKRLLQVGETYYTLNEVNARKIKYMIEKNLVHTDASTRSDEEIILALNNFEDFIIHKPVEEVDFNVLLFGEFFKYTHNTKFDLTRYGIFEEVEEEKYKDTCLVYAFKILGMTELKLTIVRNSVKNRKIAKKNIEEICKILKIKIILTFNEKDRKTEKQIYGKDNQEIYNIALVDGHYFVNEKTAINSYCIENYEKVKDIKDCHKIYKYRKGKGYDREERYIDSFNLVKLLLEHKDKLLKEITIDNREIASTAFYSQINKDKLISLEVQDSDFKEIEYEVKEDKDKFQKVFFDFETNPIKKHEAYICRTYNEGGSIDREFRGKECGLQMLKSLRFHTRLIAHNAGYDYRFIIKHLYGNSECSKGTKLFKGCGFFGKLKIEIKDSYNLISEPLRNFPKMFGIKDCVKEVMPYKLYTSENIEKKFVKISEALTLLKKEDHNQFLDNIERWGIEGNDKTYDIIEYSSIYCRLDCVILQKGYETFRKWMTELTGIDIDNVLTIASLAHQYLIKKGCYEDIKMLSGNSQRFIQKCVVGGRVMPSNNKKQRHNVKINDYDAVSLYPSAMARMDGFLKGCPKIIKDLNYDNVKKFDGYYVEIMIKEVGILRDFPLMSYVNDEGVRMFSNDMKGRLIYVDRYTLEDLIKFQNIKFEIIRGYYFDEGFNIIVKSVIREIFNNRLKMKKDGNPAEIIYKLIMNSSYGKSIMKEVSTEIIFLPNEKAKNIFIQHNYHKIKEFIQLDDSTKYKVVLHKEFNQHFNIPQIGVSILSMSKRIMNEVMCLAEDNNIHIKYQDTDSMHIEDKDIEILTNKFKEEHNRELTGKGLGQFHSDFKLDGCTDIISKRSIFLGKKSYIDELEGINIKTGNKDVGYHIRLKGIPNSCIKYTSEQLNINVFELYERLFKGEAVKFDLTEGNNKSNFKYNKNYSIETLDKFDRELTF